MKIIYTTKSLQYKQVDILKIEDIEDGDFLYLGRARIENVGSMFQLKNPIMKEGSNNIWWKDKYSSQEYKFCWIADGIIIKKEFGLQLLTEGKVKLNNPE